MKKLTKVALVAMTVATFGAVSSAAYAADPVSLPAGEAIYQASYNDIPALLWTTAADGTATPIGAGDFTGNIDEATDGARNPITGKSYLINFGYGGPCELWEVDITTGVFTYVANITGDSGDTTNCDAFDIAPDGTAWVTMYRDDTTLTLAKLDLTDGTTSDPLAVTGLTNGLSWIVVQPSTGVMWAGDWSENVFTIDLTTGVATLVIDGADVPDVSGFHDAAFDSAGRLWLTDWAETTVLYSADIDDYLASLTMQGAILIDGSGSNTGTDSLWIGPAPAAAALAATGVDGTVPLAAGLALLVLGAGAILARRSRRA